MRIPSAIINPLLLLLTFAPSAAFASKGATPCELLLQKFVTRHQITQVDPQLDPTKLGPVGQEILDSLNLNMVGHQKVKIAMAHAVQRAVVGTRSPDRPVGTFLLLGVTGTGKTRTAEALALAVNGDAKAFIKLSGGDLQEDHELAKVTGSPAGYVGHGETPTLLNRERLAKVTSKRYKVNILLVDELEKGSDALKNFLLGIMDKAEATTGANEPLNFSNTILILTSNIGQSEISRAITDRGPMIGFSSSLASRPAGPPEKRSLLVQAAATQAAEKALAPEFRNRLDYTFIFDELTAEETHQAFLMNLAAVQKESFLHNPRTQVLFYCTGAAEEYILAEGYRPEFGGRSIRRAIEHSIAQPLTNLLGSNQAASGDLIEIDLSKPDGKLVFNRRAKKLTGEQISALFEEIFGRKLNQAANAPGSTDTGADGQKTKLEVLVENLKLIKDYQYKLDLITAYLNNSEQFTDRDFLTLLRLLPKEWDWGWEDSNFVTDEMTEMKFGEWEALPFEPNQLYIYWYGLKRIRFLSPENRVKMKAALGAIIDTTAAWFDEQDLEPELRTDLLNFLSHLHSQVMKLPPPP